MEKVMYDHMKIKIMKLQRMYAWIIEKSFLHEIAESLAFMRELHEAHFHVCAMSYPVGLPDFIRLFTALTFTEHKLLYN